MSVARVGGVAIHALSLAEVKEQLMRRIAQRGAAAYVCLANVHVVETARHSPTLAAALDDASMTLPDGSPIAWAAARALGTPVTRVTGSDVFRALMAEPGLRHYFYGSTDETLRDLEAEVRTRYPQALVAGTYSPPFRTLEAAELKGVAERINNAEPDVVWVGLGAPRQELWMAQVRSILEAPVLVGVGAVFDFVAGKRRRAPHWMQARGLEWLFRFIQEPARLGPRYLRSNTSFVFHVLWGQSSEESQRGLEG